MEYLNYLIIVLIVGWFVLRMMPVKGVKHISTTDLKSELEHIKQKQFIDVRTKGEFNGGHISGFKNIPLHELDQKATILSKDKEVIIICQSGMRSQKACRTLKKLGFSNITNVKGGISAWRTKEDSI